MTATTDHRPTTTVYCDGGASPNPGAGGWGVLIERAGSEPFELAGGRADTTNNQMELTAAIRALEYTSDDPHVVIHCDSKYVVQGITEWVSGWRSRNWVTSSGAPVKNADLWKRLVGRLEAHGGSVEWRWVRGHDGNRGNERADELATAGREHAKAHSDG